MLSLDPSRTHLSVWTKWTVESGLVVSMDGTIVGYVAGGRFLSPGVCAPVVRELIDKGRVDRASLGVEIISVGPADSLRSTVPGLGDTPAILVLGVLRDSAADHAGIHAGDLIVSLAGQPVADQTSFGAAIAERRGNTEMEILRNGQRGTVSADLELAPTNRSEAGNVNPPK